MKHLKLRDALLLRVLLPMGVVMVVSGLVSYSLARAFVNASYDRSLLEEARGLAQQVAVLGEEAWLDMPAEADEILRADTSDRIFYQVLLPGGRVAAGDWVLPPRSPSQRYPQYFNTEIQGLPIRGVVVQAGQTGRGYPVLVQFAETLGKRNGLAGEMALAVIAPQLALMGLAWVAIRRGVGLGLRPLAELTHSLEVRHPNELAPLPTNNLPLELRPMLRAFNTVLARLAEAVEGQRRFIADAAHQLRTPLAALRIQLERALRETDPELRESLLQQLLIAIERTARLSTQLLMLARAEPSAAAVNPEPVDLCALAFQTGGNWIGRALDMGVDLGLNTPEHPVWVTAEPMMLGELINNLLDNALNYGGKRVTLEVAELEGCVELSVEDDGPGVPADAEARIFERFFRPAGSSGNGSGLGLAIVKEIAHAFGAEAGYRRREGSGACFFVRFPVTAEGSAVVSGTGSLNS